MIQGECSRNIEIIEHGSKCYSSMWNANVAIIHILNETKHTDDNVLEFESYLLLILYHLVIIVLST
jgi:hypothetical protein